MPRRPPGIPEHRDDGADEHIPQPRFRSALQAGSILPARARLHLNTIRMPVAWEQVEPKPGVFDFSLLDHWIGLARQQHLHLVLLWFGAWKNAFSGVRIRA
jgi:hypothetical protein